MRLTVTLSGAKREITVSALPRDFIALIYRHCLGKNNTPYFANNCFKGVLYFDEQLAVKFAEQTGTDWAGWQGSDRLHHLRGMLMESRLEMTADAEGGPPPMALNPGEIALDTMHPSMDAALARVSDKSVLAVLGSDDKSRTVYVLDDIHSDSFDQDLLGFKTADVGEFGLEEPMVLDVTYDGRAMRVQKETDRGMHMLDPQLFNRDGRLLDLYDFS